MPQPAVLTPEQQTRYFSSQASATNPLSPTDWLKTQTSAPSALPATTVSSPAPITMAADSFVNPNALLQIPGGPAQPDYKSAIASVPTLASIMNEKSPEQIAAGDTKNTIQQKILDMLKGLGGKDAATATAEEDAGLPQLNKDLKDISDQMTALDNEANGISLADPAKDPANAGRGITEQGLAPQRLEQAEQLRQIAIKKYGLAASAAVKQGNIALAEQHVQNLIKKQFGPMQADLDWLKQAYDFNTDNLSDADKKQADLINMKLKATQDFIDAHKSSVEQAMKYVLAAAPYAPANILSQAQALDPVAAIKLLTPYMPKDATGGFTLNAGDSRYDASGKLIVTAPKPASTGAGTFTSTQLNGGAANAGITIEAFKALDADTQNYFVNNFSTFEAQQKLIASGQKTAKEVATQIQSSTTLSDSVKKLLLSMLGVSAAEASTTTSSGGNWFTNGLSAVANFFGI